MGHGGIPVIASITVIYLRKRIKIAPISSLSVGGRLPGRAAPHITHQLEDGCQICVHQMRS